MKILITGGAGYKGTKLTAKLLEKGYGVAVLDNFMYGYEPIMHLSEKKNLTIIKRDIRNGVENIGQYDAIFHLAGISGFPACASNPNSAQLINVEATRRLVKEIGKDQILINASTTSMYGKKGDICLEETSVDPISTYALTKYEAEKIVQDRENSISLRFATVFGVSPKMRIDLMVNDFTYRALKEGAVVLFDSFAKRTFIHIDDAVDCYIYALDHYDLFKGSVYNAGGNHLNYSKRDIAEIIKQHVKYDIIESEISDKDLRHFIVSFDKIEKAGYVPKKNVEIGVVELLKLYSFYEVFSPYKII
jgi:nucleoside-diphosphate-sugar epimerase